MSKKNLLKRDKKNRSLFLKKEPLRLVLKYIYLNQTLPLENRWLVSVLLHKSSVTQMKNRCTQTSRGTSVLRNFRLSRIIFRDFARMGQISGIIKKSW